MDRLEDDSVDRSAIRSYRGQLDVVGVKVDHSEMVVGGVLCGCLSRGNSEGLG
jgi:hypothetical protein